MDIGRLVPDPIVLNLVGEKLDEPEFARGCMFDGFPRTVQQAKSLDETLASHGKCLNVVIALHADESELIGRMLRRAAAERRVDDNPETIAQRMEVYHRQTAPVLDYYEKTGLLERIDANGPPDEVFEQIRRVVDRHRGPQGA
jgi:adenylate kinase